MPTDLGALHILNALNDTARFLPCAACQHRILGGQSSMRFIHQHREPVRLRQARVGASTACLDETTASKRHPRMRIGEMGGDSCTGAPRLVELRNRPFRSAVGAVPGALKGTPVKGFHT